MTLDKYMNLAPHINDTCKNILLSIKSSGRIRKYVSQESLKKLVHALVLSRLDYANSLLYGATRSDLDKLQRTINSAARLTTGIKKYELTSDALRNLHWLPIECRIKFKILFNGIQVLEWFGTGLLICTYRCSSTYPLSSIV